MDALFGSSPQAKKVEAATHDILLAPDYGANMEIADEINRDPEGGKEFLKAISKRIDTRNHAVALLAIELLNVCVKNGHEHFHQHLHKQSFLDDFAKVATKKGQDPKVRDSMLRLLDNWSQGFPKQVYPNFSAEYEKLVAQGVSFPPRDQISTSPVMTPAAKPVQIDYSHPAHDKASPLSWVSPQYVAKVKLELQEVANCVEISREMLLASENAEAAKKNDTLTSMVRVLNEIHTRLSRLIVEIDHEELLGYCIEMNDIVGVIKAWHKAVVSGQQFNTPNITIPKGIFGESNANPSNLENKGEHKGEVKAGESDEFQELVSRRKKDEAKSDDAPPVAGVQNLSLEGSGSNPPATAGAGTSGVTLKEIEQILDLGNTH